LPSFITDVYEAFRGAVQDSFRMWDALEMTTRLLICLLLAGFGIFLGSRSERSGISALFFFGAFGFFAYVMAVGISLVR
jgi:hypothetical protein